MEKRVYDFCKKCGNLTLNGVCQSCGHGAPRRSRTKKVHTNSAVKYDNKTVKYSDSAINSGNKAVKIVCGVFIVFFLLGLISPLIYEFANSVSVEETETYDVNEIDLDDFDLDDYDVFDDTDTSFMGDSKWEKDESADEAVIESIVGKEHKEYTKDEISGDYYKEVVDCIDHSVSYDLQREYFTYYNEEIDAKIEISYIQLEGEGRDYTYINECLRGQVSTYEFILEDAENEDAILAGQYTTLDAYVTYNDEDKISIVYLEKTKYQETDSGIYEYIHTMNYDLNDGTDIYSENDLNYDDDFVHEFMERYEDKNGEEIPLDDSEVKELINSYDFFYFFTPLGVEAGIMTYDYDNYNYKWYTVTFKDYEEYMDFQ